MIIGNIKTSIKNKINKNYEIVFSESGKHNVD